MAVVGFAVAFSVAKVYAVKHDYVIDGNQVSDSKRVISLGQILGLEMYVCRKFQVSESNVYVSQMYKLNYYIEHCWTQFHCIFYTQ